MSSSFSSVLLGLLTILIGYVAGRLWQKAVDRMPLRRSRVLWGPVLSGHVQFIVGRFKSDNFAEPSGIVGGGDALALRELSSYFSRLGAKRISAVYVNEASMDRESNLILLGGADTNEVTADAFRLIRPGVKFAVGSHTFEVHDLAVEVSQSEGHIHRTYAADIHDDYGIIIRARNPFNPSRWLIIIAGAYGYGTWGGVKLALKDEFLQQCHELEAKLNPDIQRSGFRGWFDSDGRHHWSKAKMLWPQFECIYRVQVFDGRPRRTDIVVFRPLGDLPEDRSALQS
jgi:hypothetical protein